MFCSWCFLIIITGDRFCRYLAHISGYGYTKQSLDKDFIWRFVFCFMCIQHMHTYVSLMILVVGDRASSRAPKVDRYAKPTEPYHHRSSGYDNTPSYSSGELELQQCYSYHISLSDRLLHKGGEGWGSGRAVVQCKCKVTELSWRRSFFLLLLFIYFKTFKLLTWQN